MLIVLEQFSDLLRIDVPVLNLLYGSIENSQSAFFVINFPG